MIYEFLAEGFEEVEALCPLDLLRRSGLSVVTVCVSDDGASRMVTGAHGISVEADISAKEAAEMLRRGGDIDMIILPGGMPGTKNLDASELVHGFITKAAESDAVISAICAAPMILGKRGLLEGKKATCFPGFEEYLTGAEIGGRVAVDGKVITSCGMGAALEFGLALVEAMKGKETAEALAKAVLA